MEWTWTHKQRIKNKEKQGIKEILRHNQQIRANMTEHEHAGCLYYQRASQQIWKENKDSKQLACSMWQQHCERSLIE